MKKTALIMVVVLLSFSNSEVHACEPCSKILNFGETVQQADLIIVGEKSANGPSVMMNQFPDASDWIDIKIFDILKGQEKKKRIRVNSWDGMCSYGIDIDDGKYIIFLEKREVDHETYQYDAVNYGCSIRIYSIKDDIVVFGDEQILMGQFTGKLSKALGSIKNNMKEK